MALPCGDTVKCSCIFFFLNLQCIWCSSTQHQYIYRHHGVPTKPLNIYTLIYFTKVVQQCNFTLSICIRNVSFHLTYIREFFCERDISFTLQNKSAEVSLPGSSCSYKTFAVEQTIYWLKYKIRIFVGVARGSWINFFMTKLLWEIVL